MIDLIFFISPFNLSPFLELFLGRCWIFWSTLLIVFKRHFALLFGRLPRFQLHTFLQFYISALMCLIFPQIFILVLGMILYSVLFLTDL